jgi:hypothetical protein
MQVEKDMQLVREIAADLLLLRKDLNLTKEKANCKDFSCIVHLNG